jgi:hypothetical protein
MNSFAIDTLGPVGRVQADSFGARELGDVVAARPLSYAQLLVRNPGVTAEPPSSVENVENCEGETAETCSRLVCGRGVDDDICSHRGHTSSTASPLRYHHQPCPPTANCPGAKPHSRTLSGHERRSLARRRPSQ